MTTQLKIEKAFDVVYRMLGLISGVWTLCLIVFHFYVYFKLGYAPSYDQPSYSEFSDQPIMSFWYNLIGAYFWVGLACLFYVFPAIFLLHLIFKFTNGLKMNFRVILVSLVYCATPFLVMFVPIIGDTLWWILD